MSAKKLINDNGADVYDRVRIETGKIAYEGLILPKHNFSEEHILILKLDNGYNIGISTLDAKLKIISKAEKVRNVVQSVAENDNLPNGTKTLPFLSIRNSTRPALNC